MSTTLAPGTALPGTAISTLGWKIPVILGIVSVATLLFCGILGPDSSASFGISQSGDVFQIPELTLPGKATGIVLGLVMVAITVWSVMLRRQGRSIPAWATAVFVAAFVMAFLTAMVGGARLHEISLAGLLGGSVTLAVPLVFGSLSGVLCERVGVVNIAIEGQLLGGAFTAALVGSVTHSAMLGMLAAAVAGALVSMVLAVFSIKYLVNQVIVGVVLNVLVSGITGFFFTTLLQPDFEHLNTPPRLAEIDIPLLSAIPVIGPILFKQSIIGYAMYIAVFVVWVALFKTKWGLRVRAVGEHPQAADTLGINVNATRFWNVTLGGAIAGIGGSYFTLVAVDSFTKEISGGRGFIALAALIFGRWNPIGAFLAALLFGFADNLQSLVTIIGTPVPSQFMAMLPYLVTILAVAGLVGRSRGPAASGEPYVKE
ncbi:MULTISPECIES: ABC transporter permease [Arthrobacter]|uniref:ABC transporter permease n=2 Tax=Arthrobacter TaxID=1663 RepID=A0ABU9KKK6_9MICC|nr:ABC transporter permease [Arthrobacter sp. YJM1]MDP5227439.1 ABC transporter permease [Arthrobacter sp. YJM1]